MGSNLRSYLISSFHWLWYDFSIFCVFFHFCDCGVFELKPICAVFLYLFFMFIIRDPIRRCFDPNERSHLYAVSKTELGFSLAYVLVFFVIKEFRSLFVLLILVKALTITVFQGFKIWWWAGISRRIEQELLQATGK